MIWPSDIKVSTQRTNPYNTDISTADTIQKMRAIALMEAKGPIVRSACWDALQIGDTSSSRELCKCLWHWVKNHVTFRTDESIMFDEMGIDRVDKELLITPSVLLQMNQPQGDCDDFSTLIVSMMVCCRVPCSFITIAADEQEPNKFSHVYAKAYLPDENGFMYMDCSHGRFPGWEAPKFFRKAEWRIL